MKEDVENSIAPMFYRPLCESSHTRLVVSRFFRSIVGSRIRSFSTLMRGKAKILPLRRMKMRRRSRILTISWNFRIFRGVPPTKMCKNSWNHQDPRASAHFLWSHRKMRLCSRIWWSNDFLHIFVGGTPREILKFHEIVKIRERRRIFEPKICQFL